MKSDLWETNMENLVFDKNDLQGSYYALGYEFFPLSFISFSVEGGTFKKDHYSVYRDEVYPDDSPIPQNISLTMNSVEVNLNLFPLTYKRNIYPYISVGGGVYFWKYEQWGDFINFQDETVTPNAYADSQSVAFGANIKAGFIFRAGKRMGFSIEGKYRTLKDDLSSNFEGFEKLDLSGLTINIGVHFFMW